MQNTNSPFIVNILPLTNVVSNVSGVDSLASLTKAVGNIQEMVDYRTKTVYTDYLQSFTDKTLVDGCNINVLSPLNLCNVGINSNGVPYSITGTAAAAAAAAATTSTVGSGGSFIRFSGGEPAIAMNVSSNPVFQISQSGNSLFYDSRGVATEFRVSSMKFTADLANISSVVVGGTCYAQQFVTLSDKGAKTDISRLDMDSISKKLKGVHAYSFKYKGSDSEDYGLLAQEVGEVLPTCVKVCAGSLFVNYDSMVAVLLGVVRGLEERVAVLESARHS